MMFVDWIFPCFLLGPHIFCWVAPHKRSPSVNSVNVWWFLVPSDGFGCHDLWCIRILQLLLQHQTAPNASYIHSVNTGAVVSFYPMKYSLMMPVWLWCSFFSSVISPWCALYPTVFLELYIFDISSFLAAWKTSNLGSIPVEICGLNGGFSSPAPRLKKHLRLQRSTSHLIIAKIIVPHDLPIWYSQWSTQWYPQILWALRESVRESVRVPRLSSREALKGVTSLKLLSPWRMQTGILWFLWGFP